MKALMAVLLVGAALAGCAPVQPRQANQQSAAAAPAAAAPPLRSRVVRSFNYERNDLWKIACQPDACTGGTVFTVPVDMPAGTPVDVSLTATLDHNISAGDRLLVLGAHSRGRTTRPARMRPGYFRISGRRINTTTMQWVLRSYVTDANREYFHVIVHGRDRGGANGYRITGERGTLSIEVAPSG